MKLFGCQWLVASSLLLGLVAANAETRPQYGGTLHITMHQSANSLDPADRSTPDSVGRRSIASLIFDTLITTDDIGRMQPALAESWQFTGGTQRALFRLRRNIRFHDGTVLTAEAVAASLRFANPAWNVLASGDTVVIEKDAAGGSLLAELALPRNSIVKRDSADGKLVGTGPFHIGSWDPGKKLVLAAEDNYWAGRPFLDAIEIELAKNFRDQAMSLQSGHADVIETAPEQVQHATGDGTHIGKSAPLMLFALLFTRDAASDEERSLRNALALSIERGSIYDVLLRHAGLQAGSILPSWLSGYAFVFSTSADLSRARQLRGNSRTVPTWRLRYDGSEGLDRLVAERIALNAGDTGLSIQPVASGTSDIRLVRVPLDSADPWVALQDLLSQCDLGPATGKANSIADLYTAEKEILASGRLIPLFHLPVSYASSAGLKSWGIRMDGSLELSNAWLETRKP